jgi:hypothetical protein
MSIKIRLFQIFIKLFHVHQRVKYQFKYIAQRIKRQILHQLQFLNNFICFQLLQVEHKHGLSLS